MTGPQKQGERRKVWTRLKNGLFGWRIVRGTGLNKTNSAIPTSQLKTDSIINEQQLFRWVPDQLSTNNNLKNISGKEKGFYKRKFEVGASDQTGGRRNLRWKPDLTLNSDTDLVRPDERTT